MSEEDGTGVWLWRSLVGISMTSLVAITFKGCEFRDETRDRLTTLERNWFYMREVDARQSARLDHLDSFINERAGYVIQELEDINDRLNVILPPINRAGPTQRMHRQLQQVLPSSPEETEKLFEPELPRGR
jgi:hypothetical protein